MEGLRNGAQAAGALMDRFRDIVRFGELIHGFAPQAVEEFAADLVRHVAYKAAQATVLVFATAAAFYWVYRQHS